MIPHAHAHAIHDELLIGMAEERRLKAAAAALGRLGGKVRSAAKARAARLNARKGGWPKGRPRKPAVPPEPPPRSC